MRRLSSRRLLHSSSSSEYPAAINPPSRAKSGNSAASARPRRSTSAPCSPSPGEPPRQRDEIRRYVYGGREHLTQRGGRAERLAQCREIARPTAPEAQSRQRPLDVRAMAQVLAQCRARLGSIDVELDRIEPL